MRDPRFAKFVVLVNGAVPAAMLAWDAYQHQLGANPPNHAIHVTGMTSLVFIVLTLAITPVRKITGWNWLSHFRRMLGLYAFFYAFIHFSLYFALQESFSVTAVLDDIKNSRFIFYGMAAFVLMIPLAVTSTNGMIKRMGAAKWKRLHQLVYLTAIAAAIHYWRNGKIVGLSQKIFALIIALLLASRIILWQLAQTRKPRVTTTPA